MDGSGLFWLMAGIGAGALLTYLYMRARVAALNQHIAQTDQEINTLRKENTQLRENNAALRTTLHEREKAYRELEEKMQGIFAKLAQDTLHAQSKIFLEQTRQQLTQMMTSFKGSLDTHREQIDKIVDPLKKDLNKLEKLVQSIEAERQKAYGKLTERLAHLMKLQTELQKSTTALAEAFSRSSTVRGTFGELQLERILELAGLQENIHYTRQKQMQDRGRPDIVLLLPRGGSIPIDAKAPLKAYFEAMACKSEEQKAKLLKKHSDTVATAIKALSQRNYVQKQTPFVVMFVPHEGALSAAFEHNPNLLEYAVQHNVLLTSPITLLALLKTVHMAWAQYHAYENAQQIVHHARELMKRMRIFTKHMLKLGNSLQQATKTYNEMVGSWERRLQPQLRRFADLNLPEAQQLHQPQQIQTSVRALQPHPEEKEEE